MEILAREYGIMLFFVSNFENVLKADRSLAKAILEELQQRMDVASVAPKTTEEILQDQYIDIVSSTRIMPGGTA